MVYAIMNSKGKYLQGGQYYASKFGKLDPLRTFLYTSKREALAMAEFYGHTVVEVMLVGVGPVSR